MSSITQLGFCAQDNPSHCASMCVEVAYVGGTGVTSGALLERQSKWVMYAALRDMCKTH